MSWPKYPRLNVLVQLLKVTSVPNCGKNVKFWILHLSSDIKSM